ECCIFNKQWTSKYFFTVALKVVCLHCKESVAVFKEYNLKRHFKGKHASKYSNFYSNEKEKTASKVARMQKEQIQEHFIVKAKCGEGRCDKDILDNLEQLKSKVNDFSYFALALYESCDVKDKAQLLIFIQLSDQVTETNPDQKLIFLHCILHQEVLCKNILKLGNVVDTVIKLVNFIKARALNHRLFISLLEKSKSELKDVVYHMNVRWLSLGKVLKRVWDLSTEIDQFLKIKGKDADFSQLNDVDWIADFTFPVDVMGHMNKLNANLRKRAFYT
ncbi:GTD2B protein, partial [Polyodon spathula]|nr:GTD2B protein [Polyodon spathula]